MPASRIPDYRIFIGTWHTHGDVLATESAPATTLTATDTYRWLAGEHFIVHEVDARFGDQPTRSMEVIGHDDATGMVLARSYDDQGSSERFEVELVGLRWRITGDTTRFDGHFDPEGRRLTGLWELKGPTQGWQPWIRLTLVRA